MFPTRASLLVLLALLLVPTTASAAPKTVCTGADADASSATSADGKTVYYVETDATRDDKTAQGDVSHTRICAGGRVVLEGRDLPSNAGVEKTLAGFGDLLLSPDGATLYFTTSAWAVGGAAHAIDIATGKERFLVDGQIVSVLTKGPYKGNLLASHYRLDDKHPIESPEYRGRIVMFSVVSPTGKTVVKLPEDDAAREKALGN